jgi:hypothetical protein
MASSQDGWASLAETMLLGPRADGRGGVEVIGRGQRMRLCVLGRGMLAKNAQAMARRRRSRALITPPRSDPIAARKLIHPAATPAA